MSRQGNHKKLQYGADGIGNGYERKQCRDNGSSVCCQNKKELPNETTVGGVLDKEKHFRCGEHENGDCSGLLPTATTREIKKSTRCLFKAKKNLKDDHLLNINDDVKSLMSESCSHQQLNMPTPFSVEDLRISMVTGGNLEQFMISKDDDESLSKCDDVEEAVKSEPKLYIAVPVSLPEEAHMMDQWRFEDQIDVNETKTNTEQLAMLDKDSMDSSPMHLTFSGSGQELMLMTPQELERMPESGIEFEESVGPKETLSASVIESGSDGGGSGVDSEAGTLATISISTDRDTDTTSIVINTKQGQQAFKINTTDLMQAAATLQPIMLADLVKEHAGEVYGSVDVSNSEEGTCINKSPKVISLPSAGCIQDEKNGTGLICTHTGRCKKAWTCPDCGKLFNKQCKLKVHMLMHAGCRPFKCSVDGCDWTFTSVYKLNRHQESHCSAKEFRCDFEGCDRSFTTVYNLNSHKKIHIQPNIVTCPIDNCNLQFQTRRKMQLHLREHEGVEAPYKCTVESCGKTYYTANSMASHLRVHKNNRLQCTFEGCDKVFDRMSRFKTHVWKHTGERPYICTYEGCTWAFSSASKLKRHMRKHTGERQYTCKEPGCGKSFMRLEHLQGHTITHSGDKPFHCHHQNCDARFTAKSSLYVHLKKHRTNGEKTSHLCPVETCGKRYNCKSSLRIHMLRYHSNESSDVNMMGGITLIAADETDSQTVLPENFQQQGLVTVTVSQSEDDPGLLADSVEHNLVEAPEFLLAPVIDEGPVVTSNGLEAELIYPPDSNNLVMTSQCSTSSSTEMILPSSIATPSSEMDPLGLLCVLQANNSGSARTDYCCNHLLTNRSRKRRRQQQKQRQAELESEGVSEEVVTSSDVVLTSTAFQPPITDASNILYLPNTLLPDDAPPSHGELYQEDGLLSSMAKDLAVPISLLTEQSNSHGDFTGTTINLQDLE